MGWTSRGAWQDYPHTCRAQPAFFKQEASGKGQIPAWLPPHQGFESAVIKFLNLVLYIAAFWKGHKSWEERWPFYFGSLGREGRNPWNMCSASSREKHLAPNLELDLNLFTFWRPSGSLFQAKSLWDQGESLYQFRVAWTKQKLFRTKKGETYVTHEKNILSGRIWREWND